MIDNDYSDDDDDDKGDPIDNDMKIQRQQCWQGNPREGWIHPRPKSFHPDDNDDNGGDDNDDNDDDDDNDDNDKDKLRIIKCFFLLYS